MASGTGQQQVDTMEEMYDLACEAFKANISEEYFDIIVDQAYKGKRVHAIMVVDKESKGRSAKPAVAKNARKATSAAKYAAAGEHSTLGKPAAVAGRTTAGQSAFASKPAYAKRDRSIAFDDEYEEEELEVEDDDDNYESVGCSDEEVSEVGKRNWKSAKRARRT